MSWGFRLEDLEIGWGELVVSTHLNEVAELSATNYRLPIVGRSGAGKSTLMYVIAAVKAPSSGAVEWCFPDGEKVSWNHLDWRRARDKRAWHDVRYRRFGFAFQDNMLLPYLTVKENLMYPLEVQKGKVNRRRSRARDVARQQLERVLVPGEDVERIEASYPEQLSGGQQQRISLAQAMVTDPTVLFADEPTGSLDLVTRREVMAVVQQWLDDHQGQRAFVWVTHHEDDPALMNATRLFRVDRREREQFATVELSGVNPAS